MNYTWENGSWPKGTWRKGRELVEGKMVIDRKVMVFGDIGVDKMVIDKSVIVKLYLRKL